MNVILRRFNVRVPFHSKHNVFLNRHSYFVDTKPPVKYFRDEGFQTWSSPQTSRHLPLSNTRFYPWPIISAHLISGCLSHIILRECTSSRAVSVHASPPRFNSADKIAHNLLISTAGKERRTWLWRLQFFKYSPTLNQLRIIYCTEIRQMAVTKMQFIAVNKRVEWGKRKGKALMTSSVNLLISQLEIRQQRGTTAESWIKCVWFVWGGGECGLKE